MQLVEFTDAQRHSQFINPGFVVLLRQYRSDSCDDGTLPVLNAGDDAPYGI
jgi:hypothetical protein